MKASEGREESPAVGLVRHVAQNLGHQKGRVSHDLWRDAVTSALRLAIRAHLEFGRDDFHILAADMRVPIDEADYTLACADDLWRSRHGPNRSAAIAFERWKGRKPFILKDCSKSGRRLAVGSNFKWQGDRVYVTSFAEDGQSLTACCYKTFHPKRKIKRRYRATREQLQAWNRQMDQSS